MEIEIPDIPKAVYEEKQSRIQAFPCHSNRASSLGYFVPELKGCLRRGVYERTQWQNKELHDGRVQAIFDEGNHQERIIIRDISDTDIELIEQQRSYVWDDYKITGHIDGKVLAKIKGTGQPIGVPCEIKSMAPHIFTSVHTFEDFKKKPWTRSYMVQIQLYMLMENIDQAIFILKNKSTGELKQIQVGLDYEISEWALKAAETINDHVARKTMPDRITDIDACGRCPYKAMCQTNVDFGQPLQIADDPDFEKRIQEYMENKAESKRIQGIYDKEIRPKAMATADSSGGALNAFVGNYHLTGKRDAKGTFRLKVDPIGGE